jgi:hypothetical protein
MYASIPRLVHVDTVAAWLLHFNHTWLRLASPARVNWPSRALAFIHKRARFQLYGGAVSRFFFLPCNFSVVFKNVCLAALSNRFVVDVASGTFAWVDGGGGDEDEDGDGDGENEAAAGAMAATSEQAAMAATDALKTISVSEILGQMTFPSFFECFFLFVNVCVCVCFFF